MFRTALKNSKSCDILNRFASQPKNLSSSNWTCKVVRDKPWLEGEFALNTHFPKHQLVACLNRSFEIENPKKRPQRSIKETLKKDDESLVKAWEEMFQRDPKSISTKVLRVLTEHSEYPELLIAFSAQRIRNIPLPEKSRKEIWPTLFGIVKKWRKDPTKKEFYLRSLPSLLPIGRGSSIAFLGNLIERGTEEEVNALATSFFAGSPRAGELYKAFCDEDINTLYSKSVERLERSTKGIPALIWALGPMTSKENLPITCRVIKTAFCTPKGIEDAAAIRVGRMLVYTWREHALKNIFDTLQNAETCIKFASLMVRR